MINTRIFLIFFLVITIGFLQSCGFGNYSPEIVGMNEETFDFKSTKPIYYQIDNKLYFSKEGKFDLGQNPIWTKGLNKPAKTSLRYSKFVSPNSKYILINNESELVVLDNKGKVVDVIDSFCNFLDGNCGENMFSGDDIQWKHDSKSFYIKKFMNYKRHNPLTEIFEYTIKNGQLKSIITVEMDDSEFYLSKDEKNIYYKIVESGDFVFNKLNIESGEIEQVIDFEKEKDSIFINFPVGVNILSMDVNKTYSYNDSEIEMMCYGESYNIKGGLYMKRNDSVFHIINVKDGYLSFKEVEYNIKTQNSFFLPGNRYFVLTDIDTKNFEGSLIVDTEQMQVRKFESIDDCFFSLTNRDYTNYKVGNYKVIVPVINTFWKNPDKYKNRIIEKY
jgi:hypothetical protein